MKKSLFIFLASLLCMAYNGRSQIYMAAEASKKITGAECIALKKGYDLPVYLKMRQGYEINFSDWQPWIMKVMKINPEMGFAFMNVQQDPSGEMHYRYIQTYEDIPIQGTALIVHSKNDNVYSFNGNIISSISISNSKILSESKALSSALFYVNATTYKWQITGEESRLKSITGNQAATYYPQATPYYISDKGTYHLAYRFDIYASIPLKRSYIFVDAQNGNILLDLNRIQTTDVPGTAVTKYSGTQIITTDSTAAASYRLRETNRGNGVETYNMQTGTNYGSAIDFTDTDNNWNNVNAAHDEIATDAHWGAEMTYDYYFNSFNRNSIDDAGFALISYVHYDVDYSNAFWDGTCMTYGDGDGSSYTPFTALDICGHEITHGLDEKTANLNYQDESGALNEGFSDIFGTAIEFYAKPADANWTMGEDIGNVIRSLATPKVFECPNTYGGTYWYTGTADNGGVHTNCGVVGYWYYLLCQGGSGTNDNSVSYNITGIGMDKASAVAYHTLTAYLTNTSDYEDARFYSILAAIDLYGPCTPEVATVADAWYACGVGGPYDSTVVADFTASFTAFCTIPATVIFTNNSTNSNVFTWDFGDGGSSTDMNPTHTYTNYGTFDIKLISSGGVCGSDTIIKTAYVSVDSLNPCITIMPQTGTAETQTMCAGFLFDSGGSSNYQDNTNSKVTLSPFGAMNVTLTFVSFSMEQGYDYLRIYDGPTTSSPLIGSYDGTSLPNGGTITSTGGSITLLQTSDQAINESGYEIHWQCSYPTAPPVTNFIANDTSSCTGIINFTDLTTNGPISWLWDFGDGSTSTLQHPIHSYTTNGTYNVKLRTGNSLGLDSMNKAGYINVDMPVDPIGVGAERCDSGSVTLSATGGANLLWYDAPSGGSLVYSGSNYTTPVLGTTTTFYVQNSVPQPSQYIGNTESNTNGSFFTSYSEHYLIFDAFVPFTLISVEVNAGSAGNRLITLQNSAGTVLASATVAIPAGISRITLDFDVPAGMDLRLCGPASPNLWRNDDGINFPYEIPGLVSIKSTSAAPTLRYYYFYDWEVQEGSCSSNRIPVTAGILLPNAQVTPSGNQEICSGDSIQLTCQMADSYLWSPGGETTQSIYITSTGLYSVFITDSVCSASSIPTEVTVMNNPPVAGFTFADTYLNVAFTNTSADANSFTWDFGDGSTSLLENPSHTYSSAGTYTIALVAENACGTDTFSSTITVTGNGIIENIDNSVINLYPNPAHGKFYVDVSNMPENQNLNYCIYDMIGNVITTGVFSASNKNIHAYINMEGNSKGIYFIRMFNEVMNSTCKIILN